MTHRKEDRPTLEDRIEVTQVAIGSGPAVAADIAIDRLAIYLFEIMENLSPDGNSWDTLEDADKKYYRICIERLVMKADWLKTAIEGSCRLPPEMLEFR